MKEDFIELISLFDIYGSILSENEYNSFEQYYCEDFSLSEIAENLGITRQGVRDNILRAEKTLRTCEEKLKYRSLFEDIKSKVTKSKDILDEISNDNKDKNLESNIKKLSNLLDDIDI